MLEFGNADANPAGDLIKDISEATFMQDVIETSKETPVIVDFWAPWCGPCKTLTPTLEAAVNAAGGKVKLVKINVDENQQVAQQLQVQSIPAVFAFVDGRPAEGFMGAKSAAEVSEFVDKIVAMGGAGGLADALAAAEQMLEEGAAVDAAQTFAAILGEDPTCAAAYAGIIRSNLALGEDTKAEELLESVPADLQDAPEVAGVRAQIELAKAVAETGPVMELKETVAANPDDHKARFDLAIALAGDNDAEAAIAELLELFRRDREWDEGAAKTQLFKIFDTLKAEDPIVLTGRRKLSSMIFL